MDAARHTRLLKDCCKATTHLSHESCKTSTRSLCNDLTFCVDLHWLCANLSAICLTFSKLCRPRQNRANKRSYD